MPLTSKAALVIDKATANTSFSNTLEGAQHWLFRQMNLGTITVDLDSTVITRESWVKGRTSPCRQWGRIVLRFVRGL